MVRQDAWNQDDDLLLAEVVLRHIREGSTQLAAFEEVGEKLSRTPAACGFRWNSTIRKKYESAIKLAKKQRKQLKKEELFQVLKEETLPNSTASHVDLVEEDKTIVQIIDELVAFLLNKKKEFTEVQSSVEAETISPKGYEDLLEKNKTLENELNELKKEYELMKNDYLMMISVMERASKRKLDLSK